VLLLLLVLALPQTGPLEAPAWPLLLLDHLTEQALLLLPLDLLPVAHLPAAAEAVAAPAAASAAA
jgi:hypothetical protein